MGGRGGFCRADMGFCKLPYRGDAHQSHGDAHLFFKDLQDPNDSIRAVRSQSPSLQFAYSHGFGSHRKRFKDVAAS